MKRAKIRPPMKWYGGKFCLAATIVSLLPPHHTYVEPFGGAASVLLNKPPSRVEIFNDRDARLVNFFFVLRDRADELIQSVTLTPYSESEFCLSKQSKGDPVERARRFLVQYRQSFSGLGEAFARSARHRSRCRMAENVASWLSNIDDNLPQIVERLRCVEVHCRSATDLIKQYDSPNSLFYCDPPYVHSSRRAGSRAMYAFEMSDDDHRELAKVLKACKGKVVLSGYPSPLYTKLYRSWRSVSVDVPIRLPAGKQKTHRNEILWFNFPIRKKEVARVA